MSLYNMLFGFNPACIFLMPMLGRKQSEYPRFRDCFMEDDCIAIYTRVGGYNRNEGYGEEELYKDPNFVRTYDDEFDSTYGTYVFSVPEKWKADFEKIKENDLAGTSDEYKRMLYEWWPKLVESGTLDKLFGEET